MANQNLLIVNPTGTAYSNVNAAGDDIPAYSMGKDGAGTVTVLSDAEVATFAVAHPTALMLLSAGTSYIDVAVRGVVSKILLLGRNPGSSTKAQ